MLGVNLAYNVRSPYVPSLIPVTVSPVYDGLLYQPSKTYPVLVNVGNSTSSNIVYELVYVYSLSVGVPQYVSYVKVYEVVF